MGIIATLSEELFSSTKKPIPVSGSIYDFKIKGLNGEEVDFSKYKGKPLLIVNTASKCGFTPQYADLQKLQEKYGDKIFILGFPANNFLWEEPGSNKEIAEFCSINYGVSFQMFEKISVKGSDKHPIYKWLEAKTGKSPSWNFCKYFVDNAGENVKYFPSKVNPLDKAITDRITN